MLKEEYVDGRLVLVECRDSFGILLRIGRNPVFTSVHSDTTNVPISNRKIFSVFVDRDQQLNRDEFIREGVASLEQEFPGISNNSELPRKLEILLNISEMLDLLSEDIADSLIPRFNDGQISYDCARHISLKLSAVSGALSQISLGEKEGMVETLRSHLKELLVEIFINC